MTEVRFTVRADIPAPIGLGCSIHVDTCDFSKSGAPWR